MTQIYSSLERVAADPRPSVVSIGNFDGTHRGHRMVLNAIRSRALALSRLPDAAHRGPVKSVAVTFDPHPSQVLNPTRNLRLITPIAERVRLLRASGVDDVVVLPFTPELAAWSPADFARNILRQALHAVEVHEGDNFRFGAAAAGNIATLSALGSEMGFRVQAYPPYKLRGAAVSSSRIRSLIEAGNLSLARTLLGRPFAIRSTPASGRGYGTRYAVPTINLAPYDGLLPAHGVYITTLTIGEGRGARTFRGVTNAGNRPTFGADSYAVESHLLDFIPVDLSEQTPLELTFLKRLRGEVRYDSPNSLKAQIGLDVRRAQRYFALCDAVHPTVPASEEA